MFTRINKPTSDQVTLGAKVTLSGAVCFVLVAYFNYQRVIKARADVATYACLDDFKRVSPIPLASGTLPTYTGSDCRARLSGGALIEWTPGVEKVQLIKK